MLWIQLLTRFIYCKELTSHMRFFGGAFAERLVGHVFKKLRPQWNISAELCTGMPRNSTDSTSTEYPNAILGINVTVLITTAPFAT